MSPLRCRQQKGETSCPIGHLAWPVAEPGWLGPVEGALLCRAAGGVFTNDISRYARGSHLPGTDNLSCSRAPGLGREEGHIIYPAYAVITFERTGEVSFARMYVLPTLPPPPGGT